MCRHEPACWLQTRARQLVSEERQRKPISNIDPPGSILSSSRALLINSADCIAHPSGGQETNQIRNEVGGDKISFSLSLMGNYALNSSLLLIHLPQ